MLRAVRSPLFFALIALGVLLLALEMARPCYFLHDDNATWFIAAYTHDFRVLTETGRLAEVNFYQYGGEPYLEQSQTAVLYPPVYLGGAFAKIIPGDLRWTIEWLAAFHLALAVAGFYFWMRQRDVPAPLAALGGLAWALNPFVLILSASWIMVTYAAAWMPWLFWAIDRLFARATFGRALTLGGIFALFFLQGYVQWVVYAVLFGSIYVIYLLVITREVPRLRVLFYLLLAALVFLVVILPQLFATLSAVNDSAARAVPLSLAQALSYRVQWADLVHAQLGHFRPGFLFGLSTSIFFCPALVLTPFAIVRFFQVVPGVRRRLFPVILLGLLALSLSGWAHVFLNVFPVMQKIRWPFKTFLSAEFFFLAAFVLGLASLAPRWKKIATLALSALLVAQLVVALAQHDTNFISKTVLPASANPLPPGMDPTLGRVIALDDHLPEGDAYRYFTHCFSTFYQMPSFAGYNPLVSRRSLLFGAGIDFPNIEKLPVDDHLHKLLESRAVRYWITDPNLPGPLAQGWDSDLKLLASEPDRVIYEDPQAQPIAYADSLPTVALPLRYSANSMLISLHEIDGLVKVSLCPTKGWWYRLDGGKWAQAQNQDDRLWIQVNPSARLLEVAFFDPWLHNFWLNLAQAIIGIISFSLFVCFLGRKFFLLRYRLRGQIA